MPAPTPSICPETDRCWYLRLARAEPIGDPARDLACLRAASLRHACAVHAYVLMSWRIDLLVTGLLPGAVSALLGDLARTAPGREWRFQAGRTLAREEVLDAMQRIDRTPIGAGLVVDPAAWAWSSHRACTLGAIDALACPHAAYLALGRSRAERRRKYSRLLTQHEGRDAVPGGAISFRPRTNAGTLHAYDPGTPGRPALSP